MSGEAYTPGYSAGAVRFMQQRCVEREGNFVLPHLKKELRVLDVGCGPGTITKGIAQRVHEVVAVDMEASQLATARESLSAAGLNNVQFHQAGIYDLPLASDSFDLVFAHAVFEHLARPHAALKEIHRVLKPGGKVALRSPDFGGFIVHPLEPEVHAALKYYENIQLANQGDIFAGRKLKEWTVTSGFREVQWSASFGFTDDPEGIAEFFACVLEHSIPRGYPARLDVPVERVNTMAAAMRRFPQAPGAAFGGAWGEVIAQK
jgi:ubiquinone/menaquinone biosynthesis C-methylase UbiE